MKLIQVGKAHQAKLDDEDFERVVAYGHWSLLRVKNKLYAKHDWKAHGVRGTYLLHRFILNIHTMPGNSQPVDHRDHDGLNNQKENLRHTTKSINGLHREGLPSNNTSGVLGVYWSSQKRKWHAELRLNGHKNHLGFFDSLEEAFSAITKARAQQT